MPRTPERTALYRLFDAQGALLYVGISKNPERRWMEEAAIHAKTWWPRVAARQVDWHDTRVEAEAAEKAAIRSEKPEHNVAHAQAPAPDPAGGNGNLPPYLRVAELLREAILSGDIPPGATLPSEHQMVERYGFTRATIRRGIAVLRAEGLVATFQGKGAFARQRADRAVPVPIGRPEEAAALLRNWLSDEDVVTLTQALVGLLGQDPAHVARLRFEVGG